MAIPQAIAAQAPAPHDAVSARDAAHLTPAGSYLAARQASLDRDPDAAAIYYKAALRFDQRNVDLLERTFYSVLADGDINEAIRVATQLVQTDRNNRDAHLVLGVRAFKQKQWKEARAHFNQAAHGQVRDLVGTLLSSWTNYATGDTKGALDTIDKLSGPAVPEWYGIFKDMHAGLISDLAGNKKEAGKRYEQAFKIDGTILRVMQSHAGFLSRNGGHDEALRIYEDYDKQIPRYPLTIEGLALLKQDIPLPRIVETAQEGAAEVLYGLGAAFGRREEEMNFANPGLVYLQLALYLAPNHALADIALADLYEGLKKPALAIKMFERVPESSPLKHNAEIQLALDLDALERTDEAKKHLEKVIAAKPDDLEALNALAGIQRERKQYDGCAETYAKVIDLIREPTKANWTTFYYQGICHERSKQWAKAEGDFKKALELYPDQPHVLNYLGYSWIDQGVHLDEGMDMIKRSVEQRPDDGYIVDSLGWAYYRLGNYEEAVKNLERAVELKPVDPTINDHLGDVYWKVDRMLEAKFQWSHARDLKPEQDELVKIEQKLKVGLKDDKPDAAPSSNAADAEKQAKKHVGDGG
ncbi:MAG: tetratricopeptide repeat protein [Bradyrhizobiaceae bacterium]|nr:tetratricopeptide repeat protein [Bradyrhizobiaceae bacterium]